MKFYRSTLVFVALAGSDAAYADALQQQVLAGAKAVTSRDFAFTQTVRVQRTGKPARDIVQYYDPRSGTAAWTLVKIDGVAPTAKQSANSAKTSAKVPVPSYSRIAEWFGAPATRVATTPTSVTYRFAALPKGVIKMGSHDASANTFAEAVVNTTGRIPFVERVRFSSIAPFRMMMVVKVDRFVVTTINRLLPDGRPVPASVASEFSGSFMGGAQTLKTQTVYSDVQSLRP